MVIKSNKELRNCFPVNWFRSESLVVLYTCIVHKVPSPRVKFIRPIKGLMVVWSFLGHSLPANSLYHDYSVAVLHSHGERSSVIINANCWYCYSHIPLSSGFSDRYLSRNAHLGTYRYVPSCVPSCNWIVPSSLSFSHLYIFLSLFMEQPLVLSRLVQDMNVMDCNYHAAIYMYILYKCFILAFSRFLYNFVSMSFWLNFGIQ